MQQLHLIGQTLHCQHVDGTNTPFTCQRKRLTTVAQSVTDVDAGAEGRKMKPISSRHSHRLDGEKHSVKKDWHLAIGVEQLIQQLACAQCLQGFSVAVIHPT